MAICEASDDISSSCVPWEDSPLFRADIQELVIRTRQSKRLNSVRKGNRMRSKVLLFFSAIIFSFILNSGTALAQNRYFLNDSYGVSVMAGLAKAESVTGYGGVATLTLFGHLDIGLSYLAAQHKTGVGYIYKWKEVTPVVGFALVRPTGGGTWGLDLTANASSVKFFGFQHNQMGGDSLAAGLDLYFYMRQSRDLMAS